MLKVRTGYWIGIVLAMTGLLLMVDVAAGQEQPPVGGTGKAEVHQFGIVRSGIPGREVSGLLDLPDFVHKAEIAPVNDKARASNSWLEFSALYFHPPLMMKDPLVFDVRMSGTTVTAWYPYAHETSDTQVRAWDNVLVGVQADGLETSHTTWMVARAMESASTIKVYKPGPTGAKPDDEGTTEGDVYMFLRGQIYPASSPISLAAESSPDEWAFSNVSPFSDVQHPVNDTNRQAWIAQKTGNGEVISRTLEFDPETTDMVLARTPAKVELEPFSTRTLSLRRQLNEAIAGHGLRPDEAAAQAELVLRSVGKTKGPVLIYFFTPEWTNARFRLDIKGPAEKATRVFVGIQEL